MGERNIPTRIITCGRMSEAVMTRRILMFFLAACFFCETASTKENRGNCHFGARIFLFRMPNVYVYDRSAYEALIIPITCTIGAQLLPSAKLDEAK